tara:strand:- start:1012 stop:1263 length:252 start_codon:yes stop_codon:yes gene_type:complete
MKPLDQVTIDFEDNEDVYSMFDGLTEGQTVSMTIQATIGEINEDHVMASINGVEAVTPDDDGELEEVDVEYEEVEDEAVPEGS